MKRIDLLKVVLLFVALAIWAFGAHTGRRSLMIVGIGFLVVALLLRFVPKIGGRS